MLCLEWWVWEVVVFVTGLLPTNAEAQLGAIGFVMQVTVVMRGGDGGGEGARLVLVLMFIFYMTPRFASLLCLLSMPAAADAAKPNPKPNSHPTPHFSPPHSSSLHHNRTL